MCKRSFIGPSRCFRCTVRHNFRALGGEGPNPRVCCHVRFCGISSCAGQLPDLGPARLVKHHHVVAQVQVKVYFHQAASTQRHVVNRTSSTCDFSSRDALEVVVVVVVVLLPTWHANDSSVGTYMVSSHNGAPVKQQQQQQEYTKRKCKKSTPTQNNMMRGSIDLGCLAALSVTALSVCHEILVYFAWHLPSSHCLVGITTTIELGITIVEAHHQLTANPKVYPNCDVFSTTIRFRRPMRRRVQRQQPSTRQPL